MSVPTVSVIVPCHNGGRFLDGLLESLSRQIYRDFEVVIVNNGSTEQATLDKLASLDSVVRIVHQENRYLPGARNTGFREARGEYVLPLDCDDRLDPTYLMETVERLRHAPADVGFVFTHMQLTGSLSGVSLRRYDRFFQLFRNDLPCCMLIRKSVWTKVQGYDETMRDGSEDWEFSIRMIKANVRAIGIDKPLFLYSVRPDGMLLSKSARMQGTIWRQIRSRHRDAYRVPSLVSVWRAEAGSWSAGLKAFGLLGMASLLPEPLFNNIFFRMVTVARNWRVSRGKLQEIPLDA